MNNFTKILACIVITGCTLPAAAQVKTPPANTPLNQAVERAVTAQPVCTCEQEPLSVQELIEAEEELQHLRNMQDSNATFAKYPYLLDPVYRRCKQGTCACVTQTQPSHTPQEDELSTQELIEAEEELASIRNTWDMNATFGKYPYLLNPAYRRADEATQQSIRRQYTQPAWARKVGI